MIKLGKKYTDPITGFTGIATARIEYLTGCIQYQLQPKGLKADGTIKEGLWFDESRIDPEQQGSDGGPTPSSTPKFDRPR